MKGSEKLIYLKQPLPIVVVAISKKMGVELGLHGKDRKIRRTIQRCKLARVKEDGTTDAKDAELKALIKEEVAKQPTLEFKSGYIRIKEEK